MHYGTVSGSFFYMDIFLLLLCGPRTALRVVFCVRVRDAQSVCWGEVGMSGTH